MKRIIVTGAKGGTGRSIVAGLRAGGYDVLGVDIVAPVPTEAGYVRLDLRDANGLNDIFAGADGIVHFGSYPTDSWCSATEAFQNLMLGGFNVLQAAANTGIKRLVMASSIMTYGDLTRQPTLPITEDSPLVPQSIYGSSKRLQEILAADYCRWHGLSVAALRLSRIVYEGCYEWRLKQHTESELSALSVLWSYVDARDVATACQAWLESDCTGFEVFNVAAENTCIETPIADLLRKCCPQITDIRTPFATDQTPFDSGKLRRTLHWNARYDWKDLRADYQNFVRN
ncbi:MAG: NAD(P)-dependent oxidoreductase [Planctomycetaceae bacterium]|nr:NAD(P)-dependent oxidoreductase [Planctomycetaceae bacterium]